MEDLVKRFQFLSLAIPIALCVGWIAWQKGFFKERFPPRLPRALLLISVLGAFGVFLGIQLFVVPLVGYLYVSWNLGELPPLSSLEISPVTHGWLLLYGILASAGALILYTRFLGKPVWSEVWGDEWSLSKPKGYQDIGIGLAAWAVSYPAVIALAQVIGLVLMYLFEPVLVDQVAVRQLKQAASHPPLFMGMVGAIIFIVPLMEELLFRGFLQTWIRRYLEIGPAIALSSFVFAAFHLSATQGIYNIELFFSLFFLALFLGWIYERQQSLLAPITLHVIFNAVSVSLIVFGIDETI